MGFYQTLYKKPLESIDTRGFFTTVLWLFRLLIIYLQCNALLKDLTGGDTIIARPLHSNNHISFSPTHKLVVVGNYHPTVSDDSHGFWSRVVLYPFSVTIPQEQQAQGL